MSISRNINVLLYHQVGYTTNKYTNLDCFCDAQKFRTQMEFLSESDYQVVSLNKALELIFKRRDIGGKYIVLTFDDGCEMFYDVTYPVLDEFDFPATIYPVAGYLGRRATWGNLKNPDLNILSKRKLVELHRYGVEIGAHTMDHVKLTQVGRDIAVRQVKESKETLEQIIGDNIGSFAYPHGKYNSETIEYIKTAGFTNALTCINDFAEKAPSSYEIPRKYITYFDDLDSFRQKLS